ncbi:MAG: helix-turn-helix transcriptional regulator [Nitrospirae bacterium]|nr:helix-turn-helix transcriptional regulator [Nitrospirota bacterium]
MDPKEIKILLLRNDIRQTDIARKLGLKKSTICRVINGKGKSRRVQAYIAAILRVPFQALWNT